MRKTSLAFRSVFQVACLVVVSASSAASMGSEQEQCQKLIQMHQWVRLFGGPFALPRELALLGGETGTHYFEERNFPGKPITATGAAAIGKESQYQKDWVAREKGTSRLLSSKKRGSLVVQVFLEPDRDVLHYVHVTDGDSYVVLIGPVGKRWKELLEASDKVMACTQGSK